jgi:hypothetical protein
MSEKVFIQIDTKVKEAKEDSLAYLESWKSDLEKAAAEELLQKQAKQASKKSAIEKLTALGLTEQEVYDLLGITPSKPETE